MKINTGYKHFNKQLNELENIYISTSGLYYFDSSTNSRHCAFVDVLRK